MLSDCWWQGKPIISQSSVVYHVAFVSKAALLPVIFVEEWNCGTVAVGQEVRPECVQGDHMDRITTKARSRFQYGRAQVLLMSVHTELERLCSTLVGSSFQHLHCFYQF